MVRCPAGTWMSLPLCPPVVACDVRLPVRKIWTLLAVVVVVAAILLVLALVTLDGSEVLALVVLANLGAELSIVD